MARSVSVFAVVVIGLFACAPAWAVKEKLQVRGQIVSFECGDNCYLTIRTDYGKEITALCAAPECATWNDQTEMPAKFRGKWIAVSIEKGTQIDGNMDEVGAFPAFSKIRFAK